MRSFTIRFLLALAILSGAMTFEGCATQEERMHGPIEPEITYEEYFSYSGAASMLFEKVVMPGEKSPRFNGVVEVFQSKSLAICFDHKFWHKAKVKNVSLRVDDKPHRIAHGVWNGTHLVMVARDKLPKYAKICLIVLQTDGKQTELNYTLQGDNLIKGKVINTL